MPLHNHRKKSRTTPYRWGYCRIQNSHPLPVFLLCNTNTDVHNNWII